MKRGAHTASAVGSIIFALGTGAVYARPAAGNTNLSIPAVDGSSTMLHEVVVTGSRHPGVTVTNSSAPVQLLSATALKSVAGSPSLMDALAQTVPSFIVQAFGNDMAAQTLQVKLRGLSCNEVLVLVNGKPRHTTANIEVDSGPFQGCAGADLGFIPLDSIARVEVLTDGAAAQYGSGAMAGVINVILKKKSSGGSISYTDGGYMDGGGGTWDVSANAGFQPIAGSYVNLTAEARHHGSSNRSGIDEQVLNPANLGRFPDSNMPQAAGYPYLGAEEGDARYDLKLIELNAGVNLGGGMQLYTFGTYGYKRSQAFQIYRIPSQVAYTNPATSLTSYAFLYGFTPLEASRERDYSATAGIKGVSAGWNWDLSSTYGRDHFNAYSLNSVNQAVYASNGKVQPRDFYDGYLQSTQWTSNLDVNRAFHVGLPGPLYTAFGLQYQRGSYGIGAGTTLSYLDGGAQGYPGYSPSAAGTHYRRAEAAYMDLAAQLSQRLRIDAAGRYADYSDFGSAAVGKITVRYAINPRVALRGTVSNGFRAPTLAEEYYTSTNVEVGTAFVQLAPDSSAARLLGLGDGLHPERSMNYSIGVVWHPVRAVIGTLDLYQINITNRIVATGNLYGTLFGVAQPSAAAVNEAILASGNQIVPSVLATGSTGVTLFANGIDTGTQGADLSLQFLSHYRFGRIDWSVRATYNRTEITKAPAPPPQLSGLTLYNATALSDLTTASPRYVINLGALWSERKWAVKLQEQIYGKSSEWNGDNGDNPTHAVEWFNSTIGVTPITNLQVSYRLLRYLTLRAGARNLFNRYPSKYNPTLLAHYNDFPYGDVQGVFQYPMFSPFGINGGYYYASASVRF